MKTRANTLIDIEAVLTAADAELGRLIGIVVAEKGPQRVTREHASPFEALLRSIVYQQLSAPKRRGQFTVGSQRR